jgi:hypothetical protein
MIQPLADERWREGSSRHESGTQTGGRGVDGELTTQLSSQTSRLVRDEMRLAQQEFVESAKHAGIGAGLFSAAGLVSAVAASRQSAGRHAHRRGYRTAPGATVAGGAGERARTQRR